MIHSLHNPASNSSQEEPIFSSEMPSFLGVRQRTRKIYGSIQETEIPEEIKAKLDQLEKSPYTACFIPRDVILNSDVTFTLASKEIRRPLSLSFSFRSSILPARIISHFLNLEELSEDQIERIYRNLSENSSLEEIEALQDTLNEIKRVHSFNVQKYCMNPSFENATPPLNLHPSELLNLLKKFCTNALEMKALIDRSNALNALVSAIFPELPLLDQALLKVDADLIAIYHKTLVSSEDNFSLFSSLQHLSNQLQGNPPSLDSLKKLKELDLSSSYIETIPPFLIRALKNLESLNFSHNQSKSLPLLTSIAKISSLKSLNLSFNRFKKLPPSFLSLLPDLEELHLESNRFPEAEKKKIREECLKKNVSVFL